MTSSHILSTFRLFLNRHIIVWFSWIISICEIYGEYRTAGHLVFWKPWPAVELKCQMMVSSSEPSVNQMLFLRSIKHFRIAWVFLIDICICSICEIWWKDRNAGHLVFWKPWPVTGHTATAKFLGSITINYCCFHRAVFQNAQESVDWKWCPYLQKC